MQCQLASLSSSIDFLSQSINNILLLLYKNVILTTKYWNKICRLRPSCLRSRWLRLCRPRLRRTRCLWLCRSRLRTRTRCRRSRTRWIRRCWTSQPRCRVRRTWTQRRLPRRTSCSWSKSCWSSCWTSCHLWTSCWTSCHLWTRCWFSCDRWTFWQDHDAWSWSWCRHRYWTRTLLKRAVLILFFFIIR